MSSPLSTPFVCLEVEETNVCLNGVVQTPIKSDLFVSGRVLQRMQYFRTRLTEPWADSKDKLYLRLPDGCSTTAVTLLFEKMHCPSAEWGQVTLDIALQITQLATMFLANEEDGLISDALQLVCEATQTQADISMLLDFCEKFEAPQCVVDASKRFRIKRLSTELSDEKLAVLLRNLLISGETVMAEAAQKIMRQRARSGSEYVAKNAEILAELLGHGFASGLGVTAKQGHLTYITNGTTVNGRKGIPSHKEARGLSCVLHMASDFIQSHPEHFAKLVPLMFPKLKLKLPFDDSLRAVLKNIVQVVLDCCLLDRGPLCGEHVTSFIRVLIANGYEFLLQNNPSLPTLIERTPAADADLIANALCELDVDLTCAMVTAPLLKSLTSPMRQRLCMLILPMMHCAQLETRKLILAEVSRDDSEEECERRPKKRCRT